MTGACRPTLITTNPIVAARLYAGATDANAITVLDRSPSAPGLRPFSKMSNPAAAASPPFVVAITAPPDLSTPLSRSGIDAESRPERTVQRIRAQHRRGDEEHPKELLRRHLPRRSQQPSPA